MTARLIDQLFRVTDSNGIPLSGAKLYVYEAGTTTPINTYSDTALSSANANPVVSDSAGRFGDIFVAADDYKWILTDASDNTIETADNIEIAAAPTLSLTKLVNAQTGTSYTILTGDRGNVVTLNNSNSIAITQPQADSSNFPDGWYVTLYNKGAGTATITPTTSTIDGLAVLTLRTGETVTYVSDGTNYQIAELGGKDPGVNAQTGTTYTVLTGDRDKLVTFSNSSSIAVTLPQANTTTFKNGWSTRVKNIGAGLVTITPTTSTINGESTLKLTRDQEATIISDGTNYQCTIIGESVGSVKFGDSATPPQGWLLRDGSTIGSSGSGANFAASKYEALYQYLWDAVSDTYCPVSGGRGASGAADFAADKTLTLQDDDTYVPYGAGSAAAGVTTGAATVQSTGSIGGTADSHVLTEAELPASVTLDDTGCGDINNANSGGQFLAGVDSGAHARSVTVALGSGSGHTHNLTGATFTGNSTSVVQKSRNIYWYIKY